MISLQLDRETKLICEFSFTVKINSNFDCRESQIQLYRFQLGYVCSPKKMIMLYGFHIVRENRDVASILMVDDEMAMFYVQKMDDDLLEINLHADMFERKQ